MLALALSMNTQMDGWFIQRRGSMTPKKNDFAELDIMNESVAEAD
jgi:hypothetical protein